MAFGSSEHKKFCEINGFTEEKKITGGGKDHIYYSKQLANGQMLRTKISRGSNYKTYGRSLANKVLKSDLNLPNEEVFLESVRGRKPINYDKIIKLDAAAELAAPPQPALEPWLEEALVNQAKMPREAIHVLTQEQAQAVYNMACSTRDVIPLLSELRKVHEMDEESRLQALEPVVQQYGWGV